MSNKHAVADAYLRDEKLNSDDVRRLQVTERSVPINIESLLDAGCGNGDFLNLMRQKRKGISLFGCDISDERLKRSGLIGSGAVFVRCDLSNIGMGENSVDCVVCLEVLEHCVNYKEIFAELLRVSKRFVLVSVPYREKIKKEVCIHCGETTPRFGHLNSFTEDDLKSLIGPSQGKVKKIGYIDNMLVRKIPFLALLPNALVSVLMSACNRVFKKRAVWFFVLYEKNKGMI